MEGIVLNFRFKIDPSKQKVLNTLSTDEKEESNISDFS